MKKQGDNGMKIKKTKTDCFLSYEVRYTSKTEKQMKELEKQIYLELLKDKNFDSKVLTDSKYRNINRMKVKKTLKILILNLIRALNHNKPLIITLNNSVLSKQGISRNVFKGLIESLNSLEFIEVIKGNNIAKLRTLIKATDKLKNLIIKHTVEYTEEIKAKYIDTTEYPNTDKIKITFESLDGNRYAKFIQINQTDYIFSKLLEDENTVFYLKINNRKQIVDIR